MRGPGAGVLPHRADARVELATLLFQLPPTFKKDAAILRAFVSRLRPEDARGVRVPPFVGHDAEIFDVLRGGTSSVSPTARR